MDRFFFFLSRCFFGFFLGGRLSFRRVFLVGLGIDFLVGLLRSFLFGLLMSFLIGLIFSLIVSLIVSLIISLLVSLAASLFRSLLPSLLLSLLLSLRKVHPLGDLLLELLVLFSLQPFTSQDLLALSFLGVLCIFHLLSLLIVNFSLQLDSGAHLRLLLTDRLRSTAVGHLTHSLEVTASQLGPRVVDVGVGLFLGHVVHGLIDLIEVRVGRVEDLLGVRNLFHVGIELLAVEVESSVQFFVRVRNLLHGFLHLPLIWIALSL
mmetsp:Transcript_24589/g.38174  ORF Transcript_24589/g.38174 Transcript_24589/m.38174 type:complete len:263 (-) Transcript_24589:463-1251(-)